MVIEKPFKYRGNRFIVSVEYDEPDASVGYTGCCVLLSFFHQGEDIIDLLNETQKEDIEDLIHESITYHDLK